MSETTRIEYNTTNYLPRESKEEGQLHIKLKPAGTAAECTRIPEYESKYYPITLPARSYVLSGRNAGGEDVQTTLNLKSGTYAPEVRFYPAAGIALTKDLIVLGPGWQMDAAPLHSVATYLQMSGFNVMVQSQLCHGAVDASECPRAEDNTFAPWLGTEHAKVMMGAIAAIKQDYPGKFDKIVLAGHSMRGQVILDAALSPREALVRGLKAKGQPVAADSSQLSALVLINPWLNYNFLGGIAQAFEGATTKLFTNREQKVIQWMYNMTSAEDWWHQSSANRAAFLHEQHACSIEKQSCEAKHPDGKTHVWHLVKTAQLNHGASREKWTVENFGRLFQELGGGNKPENIVAGAERVHILHSRWDTLVPFRQSRQLQKIINTAVKDITGRIAATAVHKLKRLEDATGKEMVNAGAGISERNVNHNTPGEIPAMIALKIGEAACTESGCKPRTLSLNFCESPVDKPDVIAQKRQDGMRLTGREKKYLAKAQEKAGTHLATAQISPQQQTAR